MTALSPVWTEPNGDYLVRFFGGADHDAEIAILKDYLQREGSLDDSTLGRIMPASINAIERAVKRPVRKRKYFSYFSRPPQGSDFISLPVTPVISVDALEAYENGVWSSVASTRYRTIRTWDNEEPAPAGATLVEKAGDGWGDIDVDDVTDCFRVSWTGGWDPVPSPLRVAALRLIRDNFTMRGTLIDVEQYRAGTAVQAAIQAYQLPMTVRFL